MARRLPPLRREPAHPSFFVDKLWSYFVPQPPSDAVRDTLMNTYRGSGWGIRPVLEEILMSPDLYQGPPMVKPPVVQLAGMLRKLGRGIDTEAWTWLCDQAGQLLFWPPNVSGWDDTRWLDTSRMRARWNLVDYALDGTSVDVWGDPYSTTETPDEALSRALASWGGPTCAATPGRAARLRPASRVAGRRPGSRAPTGRCARTPCCS